MLAESRRAFQNYSNTLTDIEKSLLGTYDGIPPKLQGWAFYRCGLRNSPVAQSLARLLRGQGWVEAPRGVKMRGTELWDGDDGGLIVCAPQEVYRRMKAIEEEAVSIAAMRTQAQKLDGLAGTFRGMPGVEVDAFDVQAGVDTAENVVSNQLDARARRRQ
jgi:hypothetical protein